MLRISQLQMDIFSKSLVDEFSITTMVALRKKFPIKTKDLPDEKLKKLIKVGIAKAENYHIIKKQDVSIYIEYMMFCGEDFDTNMSSTWAAKILRTRNISGNEKISRLLRSKPLISETE